MEHITLKELAEELGMDRSNLRKYVVAQGISTFEVRKLSSKGQKMLALLPEDANRVRVGLAWRTGYTVQQQRDIRLARADRALRGVVEDVARDRTSVTAAKTKLALYLIDGIKVDRGIRKIIENL